MPGVCTCMHVDIETDGRTDGRKDGQTDGQMDIPCLHARHAYMHVMFTCRSCLQACMHVYIHASHRDVALRGSHSPRSRSRRRSCWQQSPCGACPAASVSLSVGGGVRKWMKLEGTRRVSRGFQGAPGGSRGSQTMVGG